MNKELSEQEEIKNPFDGFKTAFTDFEWGISLSVGGYLFLIFLGLSYNFFYFASFKINIFLFSEINDFLMAPLANPFLILFSLLSVSFVFFLYYLSFIWQKKYSKSYQAIFRIVFGKNADREKMNKIYNSPIVISFILVLYLFIAAIYYGMYRSYKTSHDKNLFHYKLSIDNATLKNCDSLIYVGDNSAQYFLYDTINRQATVIPKDQVKFVRIIKNPKGKFF